jgi:hypothetical protein
MESARRSATATVITVAGRRARRVGARQSVVFEHSTDQDNFDAQLEKIGDRAP